MAPMAEPSAASSIEVEPFVQQSAREAWRTFKADPLLYIAGSLIVAVVGGVSLLILAGPLTVGFIDVVRRRRRGESVRIADVFGGMSQFASSFVAFVLVALATAIGCLLLVVPGLVVLIVSCFAFHEIAYRKAHAADGLRASFFIAKRNLLHVLVVLIGVAALNALGSAVLFGMLLTVPFALVWMTVAYELLTGQMPERAPLSVPPAPAV
jgi:uncharacterized membrane protein